MSDTPVPKIKKLPFFLGDAFLLAAAGAVVQFGSRPLGLWEAVVCTGSVGFGAWLSVLPFLEEYRGSLKLAESGNLVDSLAQINQVESVAAQIAAATGQWQGIHEHTGKAIQTGKELFDRMQAETKEFRAFLEKSNDVERSRLRLEVEKLRRAEGDWLQILVRLLDNTFVLFQAAVRSKQAPLIEQIGQFQNVSREIARRVGLVPLTPKPGDAFDPGLHEPAGGNAKPVEGGLVGEVVATGYTFQGQLIRKPLVAVVAPVEETVAAPPEESPPWAVAVQEPSAPGSGASRESNPAHGEAGSIEEVEARGAVGSSPSIESEASDEEGQSRSAGPNSGPAAREEAGEAGGGGPRQPMLL